MQHSGFSEWQQWYGHGCRRLPATAVRRGVELPPNWDAFTEEPATVLLESGGSGRYTFVCGRPEHVLFAWNDRIEVWTDDAQRRLRTEAGAPLEALARWLRGRRAPTLPGWPAMTGGLIGVFGYDLVHTWERLPARADRDLSLPVCALIEPRELLIYDHTTRELGAIVWTDVGGGRAPSIDEFGATAAKAEAALDRWRAAVESAGFERPDATRVSRAPGRGSIGGMPHRPAGVEASFGAGEFERAVRDVLDYIAAGDTYQVNLSRRESRPTTADPRRVYAALRTINPSPYMGLLRLPEWSLVCGSPELLVRLVDGMVSSRPIAGTRPRGADAGADREFSAELLANEKERAEHLMLVDLIRNDIGRAAQFGSVHVSEFMVLERYSHVMHIVSQVEGRLAANCGWTDVVRAMFPGGTITGCPKIRTMEIIDELEPVGRGFYTGALGWVSYAGEMELNIVIRSMLVHAGVAHVAAGAGIVADSVPERELDEARRKARALWVALDHAESLDDSR